MKLKYLKQILLLILAGVFLNVTFLNCSQQFAVKNDDLSSLNESSANLSLSCTLQDGSKVEPGGTVRGYNLMSALYPMLCGAQVTRTCLKTGQFDFLNPVFNSCSQQCLHPENNQAVSSGSTYVYYSKSTGISQADCDSAKITSTCQQSTGIFSPLVPAQKFSSCLVQGQTCAYTSSTGTAVPTGNAINSTVSGFANPTATFPGLCGAQVTRTCGANGSWGGSVPLYTNCLQKCVHPDTAQPVDLNSNYIYFTISQGSVAQCAAAKVTSTCQNTGLFSPVPASARFATCVEFPLPTVSNFIGAPNPVVSGSVVNLSWTSTNAVSLTLNPGMINVTGKNNIIISPTATTNYTLIATNPAGSTSSSVSIVVTGPLLGEALYTKNCASCHSSFAVSNLKGRNVTSSIITTAMTSKISAMKPLEGTMSTAQIDSIAALFSTSGGGTDPVLNSKFACASTEAEKQNSQNLMRLSGVELKNTYAAILPAAIWNSLSANYYLIPQDKVEGLVSDFKTQFTVDTSEQISRFNELLSAQVIASNANVSALFGTCATLTSFSKACFDTFLTSKGPFIFRSALTASDNSELWSVVSMAPTVPDQLKTLTQLLFNDPRFQYHLEIGEGAASAAGLVSLTSYEIANRIAYGMTSAPPDATLWTAATSNSLKNLTNINTQVDRIATGVAFKSRIIELLKFYTGTPIAGSAPAHTEFMNGIDGNGLDIAATNEFNEFISYIVFTQKGTLKDLFSSKAAFPKTGALASVLGTNVWSSGNPMTSPNHAGLLTKPYLQLIGNPSLKLVQRGRKIRINMLCTDIPQPSASDLAARPTLTENDLINLNRRQYIDKATLSAANCVACHSKMNQLGYVTESYDSIGRYTTVERIYNSNGVKVATHPVVLTTTPTITEVDTRTFQNSSEFQLAFSQSDAMQQCFTRKSYQFFQRKEENLVQDSCRLNKMDTTIKKDMPLLNFFLDNFKQQSILYRNL